MNGFVFSLSALLKFRKNRRDHCQRLLAQVLADEAALVSQREKLIADTRPPVRGNPPSQPTRARRRRRSGHEALPQHPTFRKCLAESTRSGNWSPSSFISAARLFPKADAEVKVLERLEEKQRAAFLYHAERRASMSARTLGPPVGCWRNPDDPHALGRFERLLRRRHAVGGARARRFSGRRDF